MSSDYFQVNVEYFFNCTLLALRIIAKMETNTILIKTIFAGNTKQQQ